MKERKIAIVCGTALLIAAAVAVVVAARNRQQSAPPTEVPVAAAPAEVCVKAVERILAAATALMAGPTSRYDTLISHEAK